LSAITSLDYGFYFSDSQYEIRILVRCPFDFRDLIKFKRLNHIMHTQSK